MHGFPGVINQHPLLLAIKDVGRTSDHKELLPHC